MLFDREQNVFRTLCLSFFFLIKDTLDKLDVMIILNHDIRQL